MRSVLAVIGFAVKFSPLLAAFYFFIYFRQKRKKPANVYHLKPMEYEVWYQKNQKIQLMLALGYLLLAAAGLLSIWLVAVAVLFLMTVYVLRIRNNMSRIRNDHEIPSL